MGNKYLHIRRGASRAEIDAAYRKLSNDPKIAYDLEKALQLQKEYNQAIASLSKTTHSQSNYNSIQQGINSSRYQSSNNIHKKKPYKSIVILSAIFLACIYGITYAAGQYNYYNTDLIETTNTQEPAVTDDNDYLSVSTCIAGETSYSDTFDYDAMSKDLENSGYTITDYTFNNNNYVIKEDIFYTDDSDEDTEYLIATKQQNDLLFIFVSDGYFCDLFTYNNIETTYQGTPVNFTRHATYYKLLDDPSVVVEFKTTDIQTLQTVKIIMFSFIYDYENYSDLDGKFNSKVFHEEEPYYNDINKEYAVYLIEKTLEEAEALEK